MKARINVETSFFADSRFLLLVDKVKDRHKAIGLMVEAWSLAQDYWSKSNKLIPKKIWDQSNLTILLEVDLAEVRKKCVYVRGSEKQFEWLMSARERGKKGGLNSVEKRKEKYGSAIPLNAKNSPKLTEANSPKLTEANSPKLTEANFENSLPNENHEISKSDFANPEANPKLTPKLPKALTLTLNLNTNSSLSTQSTHPLFEIWNELRGSLPRAINLTAKRAKAAKARFEENSDPEYWRDIVRRLAASPFCSGDNDRGWKADFDFFLKPDTHVKTMEGKYLPKVNEPKIVYEKAGEYW